MSITSETRRESLEQLDSATINKHILSILDDGAALTAREIAYIMYVKGYIPYPVRQATAPRLTELAADGKVKTVGKKLDIDTGRKVAVYKRVKQ